MSDQAGIGEVFIRCYYDCLINNRDDVSKFYDQNSVISQSIHGDSTLGQKVTISNNYFLKLPKGCEVVVSDYSILQIPFGLHVNVFGHVLNEKRNDFFDQSFVLMNRYGYYYIVSESLKVLDAMNMVVKDNDTYVCQKIQKRAPTNEINKKFGTYIPK